MSSKLQFWKPGTQRPGSSVDRDSEIEGNIVPSAPASGNLSIASQRERLPIFKHKDELLFSVEKYGVVIVHAQTGAGKTTQIPQYLHEAGWTSGSSVIACTQPRRVAATSVAQRVANEMGSLLGDEVGYTIRFEDVSDKERTRICYMTDGILFRETLIDPLLSRYSVIMIDEAHERNIYTDLLIGVLRKIRKKRPSLRLIISSATLDASRFFDYFNTSEDEVTIFSLEGRMFPVEVAHLSEPTPDYVRTAAQVTWKIHKQRENYGDILIFLTGREDIERCLEELSEIIALHEGESQKLSILPLHSGLSVEEQMRIFTPAENGVRKVVVATNIAEASITIEGIKFVIDCGFVKIRTYDPTTNLSSLSTVPISVASATQRAGRAGRTSSGVCYRLYTEQSFGSLSSTTPPEIARCDLMAPIMQLKSLGIDDLMKFDWVTSPPAESVLRAFEGLVAAEMIDSAGKLTSMGEKVAECPLEVNIARMLFKSHDYRCGEEALTIAAMISIQDVFVIPEGSAGALAELERRKFTAEEGDHLTLLNVYNAFTKYGKSSGWCRAHALSFRALSRAVSIRSQLKKYMQRFKIPIESCNGDAKRLRQCLVSGYWRNSARWMADGTYRSVRSNMVLDVHPNSVLFTRKPRSGWVVFHEMEETKKTQIRILTEIEPDWLLDFGHKFYDKRAVENR
ncbi:P-loop containing nucleoside triphosphate hydrolase [Pyrrhoderma noxium]|uniref:RNA helicase n=1 Tax=Pyrrhoderma noxium TaxID=2282107 RepID=A0A286UV51_9AGAM|nr:P-loop containing nucleoside triphosphate hydrolase [Pyrrhoderma noxium]